jgi:hypothetical protein
MTAGNTVSRIAIIVGSLLAGISGSLPAHANSRGGETEIGAPARQISAFYMFRSWQSPDKLVMIVSLGQGRVPGDGPEFQSFDDDAVYRINLDNNGDGVADDLVYEFRFDSHLRGQARDLPWPYVGIPYAADSALRGITALEGEGSQGMLLRQTYSVTQIKQGRRSTLFKNRRLIAVPPNVGAGTMPDYEGLAAQGIYRDGSAGIRVFAGPRADTAYGDVGGLFDGVNLRRTPPFLTEQEDNSNSANSFGVNRARNSNVQVIALEIPIQLATADGKPAEASAAPFIGGYASVHRSLLALLGPFSEFARHSQHLPTWQVSRMGNPNFRAFAVDVASKRRWDAASPEHDMQFQDLLKTPAVSQLLASATGLPAAPEPRLDLVQIIFKYPGQQLSGSDCGWPCADLLRLNVKVPPTAPERQHRLGAILSPDLAGLPNGCRPNDDITDITLRAFGGPPYFAARIGDGVNFNDGAPGAGSGDGPGYGWVSGNHLDVTVNGIVKEFPFMPTPHSGRD